MNELFRPLVGFIENVLSPLVTLLQIGTHKTANIFQMRKQPVLAVYELFGLILHVILIIIHIY